MASVNDYIQKMLKESKMRQRRADLELGSYIVVIRGLTHERREKREKLGKAFWIDYEILEAGAKDGAGTPTPAGTKLDFPIVLEGQFADMSFNDLKTFLVELTGCSPDESGAQWDRLVDIVNDEGKHSKPEQPARGMVAAVDTYARKTKTGKNAGKEKVYPRWINIPADDADGNTAAKIAERRAALDAADKAA